MGGLLTGNLALLTDAGHMFADLAALALALIAICFAKSLATPQGIYGYYRVEILTTLTNWIILIGISSPSFIKHFEGFPPPPEVQSGAMLTVAIVGLAVNTVGIYLLLSAYEESLNSRVLSAKSYRHTYVDWYYRCDHEHANAGRYYTDSLISAGI